MTIPIENILTYSVVRILTDETQNVGTGFFYRIDFEGPKSFSKLFIATNKHVIEGANTISFVITTTVNVNETNRFGQFNDQKHETISLSLGKSNHFGVVSDVVIRHPDSEVDLALIDVTVPIGRYMASNKLRIAPLMNTWLHSQSDRPLRSIETVKVVGYPDGHWDSFNNAPIARTGSTATHPLAMLEGKSNFLVDAALFGGSSGSPVFAFEAPMYLLPQGGYSPGTKASLIGILWGVVQKDTQGTLVMEKIPASIGLKPTIKTSLNLGVALHASHLLEIENIVRTGAVTSQFNERVPFRNAHD